MQVSVRVEAVQFGSAGVKVGDAEGEIAFVIGAFGVGVGGFHGLGDVVHSAGGIGMDEGSEAVVDHNFNFVFGFDSDFGVGVGDADFGRGVIIHVFQPSLGTCAGRLFVFL